MKTIKDYRKKIGLAQQQFADLFGISIDTVKAWDSGRRKPPEWAEKLIIEKLEKLRKNIKGVHHMCNEFNTIILKKGELTLTENKFKNFEKGDTIFGENSTPKELKRWSIEQKDEAKKELEKYRCTYRQPFSEHVIEEYALEYCECDEDGEFVQGSDYDLAKEA